MKLPDSELITYDITMYPATQGQRSRGQGVKVTVVLRSVIGEGVGRGVWGKDSRQD